MTSNGIINSGFVKDESPDLNQNTKQRVSGDDVTRRASYTVSRTFNVFTLCRPGVSALGAGNEDFFMPDV